MIWWPAKLSPDVRSLLDRERFIAVLPAAARARALSRARAALAAGVATRPIPSEAPMAARWAAAGLTCVATLTAGAAAYEVGIRARPAAPAVTASPPADLPASHCSAETGPTVDPHAAPAFAGKPARPGAGAARTELRLVGQARAAVARGDFVPAMQLLAEHTRRFRAGWLAEEREALQVKVLIGLGRGDEARRAAADFEARFPRSPLLSTIRQMPDSAR